MKSSLISLGNRSKYSNLRMFVIVVVEKNTDGWSAWFRNSPNDVGTGNSELLAILSLVESYGTVDMDAWDMTKLDARSRDGHNEFLLPGSAF